MQQSRNMYYIGLTAATQIRGWAEKFIGWLWCNIWSMTKCGLSFQHSLPLRSTHFFHRCCSTWIPMVKSSETHPIPNPRKSPQLQIWPHHRSDTASQPSVFDVGEQKIVRWHQIRRIWRMINQIKATVKHSSHCNHRCGCRSIVLVKQDSLHHQFFRPLWNDSSTPSQKVLNYLSSVGLSGTSRKQCS